MAGLIGITPPHVQRMNNEQDALNSKITALAAFTQSEVFDKLDDEDQHLMAAQLFAMQTYSAILNMRINRTTRRTAN